MKKVPTDMLVAAGLVAAVLAGGAALAEEPAVARRLGLDDPKATAAATPIARAARRDRNVEARRPQRLGAIAKIRRGRYVLSRLKELKAGRKNPSR
ncbi:MAG: hypothetical protein LC745_03415 [Planctomycetia bacterium]|nr:hypothetical protein [Planctomycetia bacterium]